jgi:signal transduction histidine kinase/CheY-like chemotaxis protein
MWATMRESQTDHPEFISLTNDLVESSSRKLVIATSVVGGGCLLLIGLIKSGQISLEIMPVMFGAALAFLVSYRQISRNLALSQLIWLVGFGIVIGLALVIFREAEIAFLFALIPLMAVTMIGWQAAVIAGAAVLALLVGLHFWMGAGLLPLSTIGMVGFGELLAGFIGWSAVSPLMTMVEWTNYSYRMAREKLDEARNQRLEMNQMQDDLLSANKALGQLAKSLKVMTQKAEDARRVKEEFVANVSHELRTPLNMIIGYTNLIMTSPGAYAKRLPPRLLADISSIQRNSQHLVNLVNDVLDLSQVDAGRMALTRQWTSIHEIIEAATVAVRPLFESKGLYLEKELSGEDTSVFCDSTRIREVVLNLLSNAGRFTEQGGVVVGVKRVDENLEIRVSDTGPGILTEDQQRIFEPFQQLDPMLHHKTGGSGLGLTISKRFVEMHDGSMWLESKAGQGSTFFVSIPIEPKIGLEDDRMRASRWFNPFQEYTSRSRPSKAPRADSPPRIMIVENEGTIQRLFSRYLDGVEILSTGSLEEASREMEAASARLMVINSPDADADSRLSFTNPFNVPVVTCWMPGREEAARQLGVVHYLLKPVEQKVLLSSLDEIGKEDLSVLLVDDDPETTQLFARIISLARPAARVIRAGSGREALQLMKERKPDVVVLDFVLPDLTGFDLLAEKDLDPGIQKIPVIIVSSVDPSGIPIVANRFSVRCTNGMSVREFLNCLSAISEILNSDSTGPHRELLKMLPE